MRVYWASCFFALAQFVFAQGKDGSEILAAAVAELPPCALNCTLVAIERSPCQLTDFECITKNQELLDFLHPCVKSSCTIRESLTAKRFLEDLMGAPIRDKTKLGTYTTLIAGGFALLAFLLRVVTRLPILGGSWGLDDWAITAAMVLVIPLTICAYVLNELGFGKDMWRVPFDNITKVLEIFYFTELLYLSSIAITKISILLFYLRIFPHHTLRRAIYVTIVICVLYIIAFVTATALQCLPVNMAWDRWDGTHKAKCINLNLDAWMSAGINIILDLIIICMPLRELSKLAMSKRRKFGVMLMFLVGGFVTIVSILRLKYMVQFANTENVTWDYLPIGYWSAVESQVGVIVACLPALRSLQRIILDAIFPKVNKTTFTEDTRGSSKPTKNSHKWSTKSDIPRLTLNRGSKVDRDSFIQLDEFDNYEKAGAQSQAICGRTSESSPSTSEEDLDGAARDAKVISVQKAYTVDVSYSHPLSKKRSSEERLVEERRLHR